MSTLDVLFLAAVLTPLLLGGWTTALAGLTVQAALLWQLAQHGPAGTPVDGLLNALDLLLVRAVVAPGALFALGRRGGVELRPAGLGEAMLIVGLVLAAFTFADRMEPRGASHDHLAVAAAAFALGLLLLASRSAPSTQVIGLLTLENAVTLFELNVGGEHGAPLVRAMQLLATAGAAGMALWYLRGHVALPAPAEGEAP